MLPSYSIPLLGAFLIPSTMAAVHRTKADVLIDAARRTPLQARAPYPTVQAQTVTVTATNPGLKCSVSYPWPEPGEIVAASCYCNDGETRRLAVSTTSPYNPCPDTTESPTTVTMTTGEYPFTTTLYPVLGQTTGGTEIACQSQQYADFGGSLPASRCAGDIITLSTPTPSPSLYVQAANNTSVYVGTLTSAALLSGVITALQSACPTTGSVCTASTAAIGTIEWPDDTYADGLAKGTLGLTISDAQFSSSQQMNRMIIAAGALANQTSSNATNANSNICYNAKYYTSDFRIGTTEHDYWVCDMTGGMLIEYYDGTDPDGATDRLWLAYDIEGVSAQSIIEEICQEMLAAADIALDLADLFFPELTPEIVEAEDLITFACDTISNVTQALGG